MTEILAVFRSRSQAAGCSARLRAAGVPCSLVNTPKEANVGCGLSIKFTQDFFARAKKIISSGKYPAFYCYFALKTLYGRVYFHLIN